MGLLQNGLNVVTFAIAIELVPYTVAALIAGFAALVLSFALNRHWTFGFVGREALQGHAARYALVFTAAVGLGLVILTGLVEALDLDPVVAQVIAIAAIAPLSYLAQGRWVFTEAPGAARQRPEGA